MKVDKDSTVRNILLIGASQNGKSALGNFLVTGKPLGDHPVFAIGTGTLPCTAEWKAVKTQWTYQHSYSPTDVFNHFRNHANKGETKFENQKLCTFQIIDTPGTGDVNADKESENMELLYNRLKEMRDKQEHLALALLVVKYPPFLSEELKANINFYKKMLPNIWNRNVYLVITNVEKNEAWLGKQSKGVNKDPNTIIKEIQKEIQSCLKISDEIPTVTIDSKFDSDTPEATNAVQIRELLLATCVTSPGICLNEMRLPKSKRMLEEDKRNINRLEGMKDGLNLNIASNEVSVREVAAKLADLSNKLEANTTKLKKYQKEFDEKNVKELCEIYCNRYTGECYFWPNFFYRVNAGFDVQTEFPIRDKYVARGIAKYTINEEKHVKGKVYALPWNKLNCSITLYTYKQEYYRERLTQLSSKIATVKAENESLNRESNDKSHDQENFQSQLEAYKNQLDEIDKKLIELNLEYIIL